MLARFFSLIVLGLMLFLLPVSLASAQTSAQIFQFPHLGRITTYFSSSHPGVDVATNLGTVIKPVSRGIVTMAGKSQNGLGLMVEVAHDNGYKSIYGHMSNIYVSVGQTVTTSNILGTVGMTGNTTGPHTHLEIYHNNIAINPFSILSTPTALASTGESQQGRGGSGITQLPRTGLPNYLWFGVLLLPLGWFLIQRGHIDKTPISANYIYLNRQIMKD